MRMEEEEEEVVGSVHPHHDPAVPGRGEDGREDDGGGDGLEEPPKAVHEGRAVRSVEQAAVPIHEQCVEPLLLHPRLVDLPASALVEDIPGIEEDPAARTQLCQLLTATARRRLSSRGLCQCDGALEAIPLNASNMRLQLGMATEALGLTVCLWGHGLKTFQGAGSTE